MSLSFSGKSDYLFGSVPGYEPRGILSNSFDPKASYISDMESREFGSHVDLIQSLQLRSSLVETSSLGHPGLGLEPRDLGEPLPYTRYPEYGAALQPPVSSDFILKSDLDLSLNSLALREPANVSAPVSRDI